ncbi:MAG TPA: ATP-binding protein [Rhodocyclaceae bacterium]|nr:ATP-binding protein [Rhodocyclaceae bacterium]
MNGYELAQNGRILVVDDSAVNVSILNQALEDEHEVIFALNGTDALELARTRSPDLILLDAVMPDLDGYAVCDELQAHPATREIPIIFVTSLDGSEDETRALEAGAVDFIQKPVNAAVVQARVRTHLTLKRQRDRLREAGNLLQNANAALVHSNHDLQHFAHLAAHDLQAPLNAIAGFTQLLRDECTGKVSAEADQHIAFILDSAHRMRALILDLLAYSQLDSLAQPLESTSLKKVFDEVAFILASQVSESKAIVNCGELPTVMADRQQMLQLFMNLVENALKYNESKQPEVHVFATREGNEWIIAVKDNGIGIDPKYHQQIFELFRRLHSTQAYPGSGIGLSMCQRIVSRHGGRIWVESAEGAGSTFYVSFPAGTSSAC